MNRRKAIKHIFFGGVGGAALLSGNEWYKMRQSPDLAFVSSNKPLIAALAETLIPTTDLPGAKEAGVADFIIIMVQDCTERKAQNKFINGLKDLQGYCKSKYRRPFESCTDVQKETVFGHFEKQGRPFGGILGKVQSRYLGKSFMTTLKEYTVEGYCTSEAGATRGLRYVPVPGSYKGCIRLQPGETAWATN